MKKPFVALAGLLAVSLAISSFAAAAPKTKEIIMVPNYQYVSATTVSLSIESNGLSYSGGSVKIFQDYDTSITLTLQKRSNNSSTWSNVNSWTEPFSGIGAHVFEKQYYVNSGYIYRVVNTTKVLDNGSVIETINSYSHEVAY